MTLNSLGNLGRNHLMNWHRSSLTTSLDVLAQELASGRKLDISNAVTGDYLILGDIERSTTLLTGFGRNLAEATLFTSATQVALDNAQASTQQLANDLVLAPSANTAGLVALTENALHSFHTLVESLNTSVAGRSLFSGTATGIPALSSAEEILDALRLEITGLNTPQDIQSAVHAWFSTGGFVSEAYGGNDEPISYQLSETDRVASGLNATDPAFTELLANTALAAISAEFLEFGGLSHKELLQNSGEALLQNQEALTAVRSEMGVLQERIEEATVRNSARLSALGIAKAEIVASDPYETATQLESTRLQLETLYAVTARLSGLNLASYLR